MSSWRIRPMQYFHAPPSALIQVHVDWKNQDTRPIAEGFKFSKESSRGQQFLKNSTILEVTNKVKWMLFPTPSTVFLLWVLTWGYFPIAFFRKSRRDRQTENHQCGHRLVVSHMHPQGRGSNLQSRTLQSWAHTLSTQSDGQWLTPVLISNEKQSHNWLSQLTVQ